MAAAWETLSILGVVVISAMTASFIEAYRHLREKLDRIFYPFEAPGGGVRRSG
jgi:mannose/fructose/N-acetylgalactosamine-specific phosphotransferase system component IID